MGEAGIGGGPIMEGNPVIEGANVGGYMLITWKPRARASIVSELVGVKGGAAALGVVLDIADSDEEMRAVDALGD